LAARAGCLRRLADFTMNETSSSAALSVRNCGSYSSRAGVGQLARHEDCDDDNRQ
jgi:hypothetical protein